MSFTDVNGNKWAPGQDSVVVDNDGRRWILNVQDDSVLSTAQFNAAPAGIQSNVIYFYNSNPYVLNPAGTGLIALAPGGVFNVPSITGVAATDTANIIATAMAASAAGGGMVKLPAKTITLTATLPLLSGVIYAGSTSYQFLYGNGNSGPDIGETYVGAPGTWLVGDGTFAIFSGNATDLTSGTCPYVTDADLGKNAINSCGVMNLGVANGTYGIKIGGQYNIGAMFSIFENVAAMNCTKWGMWFENIYQCVGKNLVCGKNTIGQFGIFASAAAGSGVSFNPGNSQFTQVYTISASPTARNVVLRNQLAGTQLDHINIDFGGGGAFTSNAQVTQNCSGYSNGSPNITVVDATKFALEMPVFFINGAANGFGTGSCYFVTSIVGNVIQVAAQIGGTASNASNNAGGMQAVIQGYPALEVIGYSSLYPVQPCDIYSFGCDGVLPAAALLQYANGGNYHFNLTPQGYIASNQSQTFVCRTFLNGQIISPGGHNGTGNGSVDADYLSTFYYQGTRDFNNTTPFNHNCGMGMWNSQKAAATNNINAGTMVIGIKGSSGSGLPEIYNSAGGNIHYAGGVELDTATFASGATISLKTTLSVYSGAGGGSCTLPAIVSTAGSSNVGSKVVISNPSSGNLTVNTTSSQTINGTGTSKTMSANTTNTYYAVNNGGTLYWAVN